MSLGTNSEPNGRSRINSTEDEVELENPVGLVQDVDWVEKEIFNPAFIGGRHSSLLKLKGKIDPSVCYHHVLHANPSSLVSAIADVYPESVQHVHIIHNSENNAIIAMRSTLSTGIAESIPTGGGEQTVRSTIQRGTHERHQSLRWTRRFVRKWNAMVRRVRGWFCQRRHRPGNTTDVEMEEV